LGAISKDNIDGYIALDDESLQMNNSGNIYVIDDDEGMRESMALILREAGHQVSTFSNPSLFLNTTIVKSPAVILLDMQMPGMNGLDLQEKLRRQGGATPIIFVSGQSHPKQIVDSFRNGAINFIFKPFNEEELLGAINIALDSDFKSENLKKKRSKGQDSYASLSSREKQVCDLLVQGHLSMHIAQTLDISSATVKIHKARVMEKMGVNSLQVLTALYLEAGLSPAN
jgi:FixJ family two-component response regulator